MAVHVTVTESAIEQTLVDSTEIGSVLEYRHIIREAGSLQRPSALDYDGEYPELQEKIETLATTIADEYDLPYFECTRRIGKVARGECCLLVRISSAHPKEAFRAMWEFLESLKRIEIPTGVVPA